MTELSIGIFGRGRLGRAIAEQVEGADGARLAWMLGREDQPGSADVAIDVSRGEAVEEHLQWALEAGVPLVVGATGWEVPDLENQVGDRIGVLVAPNFSLGIALVRRLSSILGRFANLDPGRDPYVNEHHHRGKADAPSGTARTLAEALLETCERKTEWTLVDGAVDSHQLSVSSVRAGEEFGRHTVGVDSAAEVLEITHRARSRRGYAEGALVAAHWIRTRTGVHTFDEVVAEVLDPLFAPQENTR